jgi:hypothetical protein
MVEAYEELPWAEIEAGEEDSMLTLDMLVKVTLEKKGVNIEEYKRILERKMDEG